MALEDSMFLFEIVVEELTSYINCREFCIRSQFADVFSISLRDPNEQGSLLHKRPRKIRMKKKTKIRNGKSGTDKSSMAAKVQAGQSILFANNVDNLISNMKQYPMELSLWSKLVPDYKIGSTQIPWASPFYDYLNKLHRKQETPLVCVKGEYNVFDEFTSKRMAVIKLNIKLSYLKDATQFGSLSVDNQISMYTGFNSKPSTVTSPVKDKPISFTEGTGTIKTIYKGEKRKVKKFIHHKYKKSKREVKNIEVSSNENIMTKSECDQLDSGTDTRKLLSGIVSLVRSDTNVDSSKQVAIIKSKSCSSLNEGHFNMLNYIFGPNMGPFGNQVYCVGYFTVQNEFADSPKSVESEKEESEKSKSSKSLKSSKSEEKVKERYKFRICDSECPARKRDTGSHTHSFCSIDLPQEASHLITLKKCDRVDCDHRIMRELPPPPDDRILIDLSSRRKDCCDISEKVEEVVGGMKATMKIGEDPCYCECECRFGFTKKTTFCNICGGYEIAGEEYAQLPGYDLPFPCPIFHKLTDKSKMKTLSTSGSDSKKKEGFTKQKSTAEKSAGEKPGGEKSAGEKSIESEKETTKKGKKKKKDDRFKFNYGYTAPQIGHSRCAMPCTGTLGAVPKNMGWLWTAENIPGIKVAQGWKPGAISNRLLRKLNQAKRQTLPVQRVKLTKKTKKRIEDKPKLIICKRNGEYHVEMQVSPANSETNVDQCSPLVYKITREDNDERIQKRLRKQRRLVKEAVDKVWEDPYHPEICEKICLPAYKQAIGITDPNNPECICSEEEEEDVCSCCNGEEEIDDDSSDCSSLDLEWEIHFSPPIAFQA